MCVPARGLGQDARELTLSMDTVVFIVIWTRDVQAAGQRILFFSNYVNTYTHTHTHTHTHTQSINNESTYAQGHLGSYITVLYKQSKDFNQRGRDK